MSNTILTPTAVTRESLRVLHQKLNFVGSINRQYDDSFAKDGAEGGKIGPDLKIRLPNRYTVRTGAALQAQDTTETSTTLTVSTQKGVDLNFTSSDLTLSLQDFSERIIDPAMSVLAANVEADAMTMYKDVYQGVWNSGSAMTIGHALSAGGKLTNSLAPMTPRVANVSVQQMLDAVTDGKALFNDKGEISTQYKEGYVGRAAGFDWMQNTLWPTHTRGAEDTNYVCNTSTGITSGTATITVSGGSGAGNKGDIFIIAGVNRVHPETKNDTGVAMQFALTADILTGATSLAVTPTPVTSGANQNVVINSAGASKAVTWAGTLSDAVDTGVLYHKDAFAFASADLIMPKGVDFSAREVMDGLSMRIVRQYDINSDKLPCRLDILYGYKTIRPQLACRVHNN